MVLQPGTGLHMANIGETGTFFGKNHIENYGTGSNQCIAGAAVNNFVGAGSFSLFNLNLAMQVVGGGNYTITSSGTSETVAMDVGGRPVLGERRSR